MGCDIHLFVEVKDEDGVWQSADTWVEEAEEDEDAEGNVVAKGTRKEVDYKASFYHGRNYNLFAILANVRNGVGFAGCDLGNGFNYIAEPRGLPDDATENVVACSERWGVDGHSHSYFTVQELLNFDWTQTSILRGWVDAETFRDWNSYGREYGEGPKSYCGMVGGGGVKHVTVAEMEKLVAKLPRRPEKLTPEQQKDIARTYCQAEWTQHYYEVASEFWSRVIPRLLHLGTPDRVRIVFWFDN